MTKADQFPKLAARPEFEFRFITTVTPSMCGEIREMQCRAFDLVQDAGWDGDRVSEARWSTRFYKLGSLSQEAAMVLLSAPVGKSKWPLVDGLVLGDDGVCRP